jgi:hypothetical protein
LRLCGKSNLFFAEDRLPFFFTLPSVLSFINLRLAIVGGFSPNRELPTRIRA